MSAIRTVGVPAGFAAGAASRCATSSGAGPAGWPDATDCGGAPGKQGLESPAESTSHSHDVSMFEYLSASNSIG